MRASRSPSAAVVREAEPSLSDDPIRLLVLTDHGDLPRDSSGVHHAVSRIAHRTRQFLQRFAGQTVEPREALSGPAGDELMTRLVATTLTTHGLVRSRDGGLIRTNLRMGEWVVGPWCDDPVPGVAALHVGPPTGTRREDEWWLLPQRIHRVQAMLARLETDSPADHALAGRIRTAVSTSIAADPDHLMTVMVGTHGYVHPPDSQPLEYGGHDLVRLAEPGSAFAQALANFAVARIADGRPEWFDVLAQVGNPS
jgi:hypothetical protein